MPSKFISRSWVIASIMTVIPLASVHGAVLVGWNVNSVTESATSLSATTFASNIIQISPSGLLSRGAGAALPGSPASNTFGASGFTATDLNGALTNNDYLTFSITVASGYSMSLTDVIVKLSATSSGATGGALFSSIGGFSSTSAAIQTFSVSGNSDQSITLSSGSFSNITGSVEFRIYAFGGSAGSTDKFRIRDLTGDDLTISGTTAVSPVPEPATYALFGGLTVLGLAAFRRRHTSRVKSASKASLSA